MTAINDLYWIPGGNPDLKPEDGYSGDLAYACKGENGNSIFSGQITGFASLIDNWIVWQPSPSGAYYREAGNLRKVFARGTEIQASGQTELANGVLLSLRVNYSHSATSNIDAVPSVDVSMGKQLLYIPKHKANLFAEVDFKDYYLKINAPFTGKPYTSNNVVKSDYETVLNPYWLLDLTLGKKIDWKQLQVDVIQCGKLNQQGLHGYFMESYARKILFINGTSSIQKMKQLLYILICTL